MKRLLGMVAVLAVASIAAASDPGAITGQVLDARTGDPVGAAEVLARGDNGDAGRARTNARGVYLIVVVE